jgi:hypothetical protein
MCGARSKNTRTLRRFFMSFESVLSMISTQRNADQNPTQDPKEDSRKYGG